MRPPPSWVVGTSCPLESTTGCPVSTSADLSCAVVQSGWRSLSSAAEPATWGEAMLVPLNWAHVPSCAGTDERMLTPGAVTSGLSRSDTGFGPADEKLAILFCLLAAAAVITPGALPGELIDPKPHS